MADQSGGQEKTEEPSEYRIQEARKKQVSILSSSVSKRFGLRE